MRAERVPNENNANVSLDPEDFVQQRERVREPPHTGNPSGDIRGQITSATIDSDAVLDVETEEDVRRHPVTMYSFPSDLTRPFLAHPSTLRCHEGS